MLIRVILAVDRSSLGDRLVDLLAPAGVEIERVKCRGNGGWSRLVRKSANVFLVSRALIPEPVDQSLGDLADLPESPAPVVLVEGDDADERARLLAAGCVAVLNVGVEDAALAEAVAAIVDGRRAIEARARADESARAPRLEDFVSTSPAMAAFMNTVRRVAPSHASLLLLGETGVGKEHLARAIHRESGRSEGPFVAVNCGAIPEGLLESELFGHVEGAFTGATRARRGYFEVAHGGTIFLDEVGDLASHLQVKLLRVLQLREIRRVGDERDVPVDVRVLAATNRDIVEEVKEGRFRSELYYRLSVVTLSIPPLRERREDIPRLVERIVADLGVQLGRRQLQVSPAAMGALVAYGWPGNVRELANVLERGALLCLDDRIRVDDLPETVNREGAPLAGSSVEEVLPGMADPLISLPLNEARERVLGEFERHYLSRLLQETGGRIGETARRAGIDPRSLYNKMQRYGLRKEDFRSGGRFDHRPVSDS